MPYQLGLWLAEYGSSSCHVCRVLPSEPTFYKAYSIISYLYKGLLCTECFADNVWLPKPFAIELDQHSTNGKSVNEMLHVQAASIYGSMMSKAIVAFKYHEDLTALPLLVFAIRQLPKPTGCHANNSVIVPMPTTKKRLLKRGFDPVTIFSHYLSQHWQIPIAFDFVKRIDQTTSQQGLTREERLVNIKGAFELKVPFKINNILLFDDVTTTGATLKALANCINNTDHHTNLSAYAIAHGNPD